MLGLTGILALIVVVLFALAIYWIVRGVKEKNWKRAIIPAVVLAAVVALLYYGLLFFITSM